MNQVPARRSRLVKLENKRLAKQTGVIIAFTLIFLVGFLVFGIPSLMKLAVVIGNSKTTSKFAAQEDKVPPLPPQLNPLTEATSSVIINLDGYSEAGSTISLYLNQKKIADTIADNENVFSFLNISLEEGINTIYAQATDAAGNTSHPSITQTVIYDNQDPSITIDSPQDGDRLYGELKQIVAVTGTTDPQVQLTVNDRQIVVTADGSFSTQYALENGDNLLIFKAIDRAGNETTQEITVNFSK